MKSECQRNDFLVFGAPEIESAEIDEVVSCLKSGWIGTGPRVHKFENEFKDYKQVKHVAAVNSCTAALHLSLLSAGVGPGDEVITTPMTFCASVNAIIHASATPVLVDVDPVSMNIDVRKIEQKINNRTKALLPVHFAGRPCDMDIICALAKKYNLALIEDCAHAVETEYKGKKAGTFGDFGAFSFYVTKNVVTGEGGMIIGNNKAKMARIKSLALHGMSQDAWKRFSDDGYKHYQVVEAGFKYNMMDIQAAIGIHQLRKVEENWKKREHLWQCYMAGLHDLPIQLPPSVESNTRHGYHLFTILIDEEKAGINRDELLTAMNKRQIGLGVHYLAIPEHPYYQKQFGWDLDDFPEAVRIGRQTVSLPLSPKLTEQDVTDVIQTIRTILGEK
jgi:dTDP-4-amino-4,6-dideoxygalactose transaminase